MRRALAIAFAAVTTASACANIVGIPDRFYDGPGAEGADGSSADGSSADGSSADGSTFGDGSSIGLDGATADVPTFPFGDACPECIDSGLCLLACKQSRPTAIAADNAAVYWTNLGDPSYQGGSVMRLDLPSSALAAIAGPFANRATEIVSTANGCVIWLEEMTGAFRGWCAGGSASTILDNQGQAVTFTGTKNTLVWAAESDTGYIKRCSLPGCASITAIALDRHTPYGLALDEANGFVYWLEAAAGAGGAVYSCPTSGCGVSTVSPFALTAATPLSVTVSAGSVYYTSGTDGQDDGIVAYLDEPTGLTTVLARKRRTPSHIVTDGKDVYWSEPGTGNDGQIVGCHPEITFLCDSSLRVLAGNLPTPTALALTTSTVYWINRGDGSGSNGSVMSALR